MKNTIPIIALSAFMILTLLGFDFMTKPAYAVDFVDFSGLNNADATVFTSFTSGGQTINAFKVLLANSPVQVNTYNAGTGALISTGASLTAECERGATAGTCFGRAMDCIGNTCYVLAGVTISATARWRLLNANTNTIIANGSASNTPLNAMDCTSTTCYFSYDVAGAERFVSINLSNGAEATIISDLGLGTYAGSIKLLTISGITYYTVTGNIINSWFDIYRTDTLTGCSSSGTQTALDAETDGTYFYVALTGGTIEIRNTSCASVGSIASANLCGGTSLQDIEISGTNLYSYCESNNRVAQTDITNPLSASLVQLLSCSGGTPTLGDYQKPIAYSSATDSIGCANFTSDSFRIIFLSGQDFSEDNEGQTGGTCLNVDTNGDGKSGTVLDCVGESTSPFDGITGGQNATDITATLTDGIGLTNCGTENPDHETCGSGLFLFLILLLLSEFLALAGYLGFTRITNAEARIMDIGLLVLIIGFVDLAIAFYLNWIPDIVFYSIVVLIAGFLAFGLFNRLRGG